MNPGVAPQPLRVHVVYEYGADGRPHASSFLRLLRPLTHPALPASWDVTFDTTYDGQPADVVIVDRLWRPDITPSMAEGLVRTVQRAGAKLVHAIDDNLHDLQHERSDWPEPRHLEALETWLDAADGVLATTAALAERYASFNPRVVVLPNALDERLMGTTVVPERDTPFGRRPVRIGYMGTRTHDDDLGMVLPALTDVCDRYPGQIELELVGVASRDVTLSALEDLPLRVIRTNLHEREYPLFLLWFTSSLRWDIALAPLRDTPFNRGKSDVKFLDYASIGAAGVFSDVPAYASSVQHGTTGWLAANEPEAWSEALAALVEDDGLRRSIANASAAYLRRERTLAVSVHRWVSAIDVVTAASEGPNPQEVDHGNNG